MRQQAGGGQVVVVVFLPRGAAGTISVTRSRGVVLMSRLPGARARGGAGTVPLGAQMPGGGAGRMRLPQHESV